MKLKIPQYKSFEKFFLLGAKNNLSVDRICAGLVAFLPILQHYKGLYRSAGFTVLLFILPMFIIRLLLAVKRGIFDKKCASAILPLIIFEVYTMVVHSVTISGILYAFFMITIFEMCSIYLQMRKRGNYDSICILLHF